MFKNVLRTFEAEILRIFKNIQPQPKIRRSYKKKKESVPHVYCGNKERGKLLMKWYY